MVWFRNGSVSSESIWRSSQWTATGKGGNIWLCFRFLKRSRFWKSSATVAGRLPPAVCGTQRPGESSSRRTQAEERIVGRARNETRKVLGKAGLPEEKPCAL